jgi:hypothetical protein
MRSPEVRSNSLEDFVQALGERPFDPSTKLRTGLAQDRPSRNKRSVKPSRISVDPEKVEQGLVKLVLALVEFLRQVLEKQAIRRMESGSLTKEEIDRLGTTLMKLEKKIKELQKHFEIDDLNINLGPLGNLID